jgi:hypothetical protein
MKASARFFVVAVILLIGAHRLPAPIVEEATPTPGASAAKSRPKPRKEEEPTKKPTPTKPKFGQFAGTWRGPVTVSFGSDIGLNGSGKSSRTIKISEDGTVFFGQSTDGQYTGQFQSKASISADGRALSWNFQQTQREGSVRGTYSLRLITPNTAGYQENGNFNGSAGNLAGKTFGMLTKQ